MNIVALSDPFFLARRALHAEIALMAHEVRGIVVDVGCGTAPYRQLFAHAAYIGIEIPRNSEHGSAKGGADVFYDGKRLPFDDACIDHVLCNQVLEHVFDPMPFLREIRRILRPGGSLLLTVPFVWDEHEQPYDFARYSSFGLRHLAESQQFVVTSARRTLSDASLLMQLWLAYWFKVVRRNGHANLAAKLFVAGLSVPSNLLGLVMAYILPANPDLYLDNAMILTKPRGDGRDDHT